MGNRVFVLDAEKKPLMPCCAARGRELLTKGKAAVYRTYPFTIILKHRVGGEVQPIAVKIDPGSKITGFALVADFPDGKEVIFAAEITHKGEAIKKALENRRNNRRNRRYRKTRHRKCRFDNRTRPEGWLPPSIKSRIDNVLTWVKKLIVRAPVVGISQELAKFDMQQMENPEIAGAEYQQGTLFGFEVKQYLLERCGHKCAYCGKKNIPLQIEHVIAIANGGTDRISNLTMACKPCNRRKGTRSIEVFLKDKPEVLARIKAQARARLTDAAAVNSTRRELFRQLEATGIPAKYGSGGRTKFNRTQQGYPKAHWIDAACIGVSGEVVRLDPVMPILNIKAMGRGRHQICRTDAFGFPWKWCARAKKVKGFQTGDHGRAQVPSGKYIGSHVGRITACAGGRFMIGSGFANHQHVRMVQRSDGYSYR